MYVFGQVVSKGLSFALVPLFTRTLTQADYGLLAICTALVSGLVPVLSLGLPMALARFYAIARDSRERRALVGSLTWATVAVLLVGGGLVELGSSALGARATLGVSWAPALRLTLWCALLGMFAALPVSLVQIAERTAAYALLMYGQPVVRVGLSVLLVVVLRGGLVGVLLAMVLSYVLLLPVYVWILVKDGGVALDRAALRRSLMFGLPLVPHNVAHWVLNLSDRVVIQPVVTAADMALYALAFQVAQIVALGTASVNDAMMPFLLNRASGPDARAVFSQVARWYTLGSGVLTVLVIAAAGPLVAILAPAHYAPATGLVAPLAVGYLLLGLYFLPRHSLFIAGRSIAIGLCSTVSAAFNVAWNLVLTPRLGIAAAAWGTTVSYLLLWGSISVLARRDRIDVNLPSQSLAVHAAVLAAAATAVLDGTAGGWAGLLMPLAAGLLGWLVVRTVGRC